MTADASQDGATTAPSAAPDDHREIRLKRGNRAGLASVSLRPVELGDVVAWQAGEIAGPVDLLSRLSGLSREDLLSITYPDADRVLAAFLRHVPEVLRREIAGVQPGQE